MLTHGHSLCLEITLQRHTSLRPLLRSTQLNKPRKHPPSRGVRRTMASSPLQGDPVKDWIMGEGGASRITKIRPVGGGCINNASHYETDAGSFFVKTNRDIGPAMFEAEAAGLEAMHATNTIRVPKPFKAGPLPGRGSYIIMEYIDFGPSASQADLGEKLGKMHKLGVSENGFGFPMDNTIGSTPQPNPWTDDWITFYSEHRLGHQLKLAQQQYRDNDLYTKGQKLLQNVGLLFEDVEEVKPCLLHGDLWSGNVASDRDGNPVILDPACYYGHNEAEFGMSWCAGFGSSFYDAYFQVMPKQPGFELRKDLYKLYHYLNHYNMFGSGYRSSCTSIVDQYIRILGL